MSKPTVPTAWLTAVDCALAVRGERPAPDAEAADLYVAGLTPAEAAEEVFSRRYVEQLAEKEAITDSCDRDEQAWLEAQDRREDWDGDGLEY